MNFVEKVETEPAHDFPGFWGNKIACFFYRFYRF